MSGDKQAIQIRTRKFIRNALLARKQFVSILAILISTKSGLFVIINIIHNRWSMWFTLAEPTLPVMNYKKSLLRWVFSYLHKGDRSWLLFSLLIAFQGQRSRQSVRLRFPHCLRWWKILWIRPCLWWLRICQEIRTKIQISQSTYQSSHYISDVVHSISNQLLFLFKQNGLAKKREGSRKQIKEKKNRGKKVWGLGRRLARHKAKKADA